MKKTICAVLMMTGVTTTAVAQDQMRDAALQMRDGQAFAEKLLQNALSPGKTGDVLLTYKGPHGFDCGVRVRYRAGLIAQVAKNAETPERACVKAVLALNKDNAL